MIISGISVQNFRNYNSASLSFTEGLNVLVGANAQGKTNLLEAIYLCAIGKSYRTSKEKLFILNNLLDLYKAKKHSNATKSAFSLKLVSTKFTLEITSEKF